MKKTPGLKARTIFFAAVMVRAFSPPAFCREKSWACASLQPRLVWGRAVGAQEFRLF